MRGGGKQPYHETAREVLDAMVAQADESGLWSGAMTKLVADVTGSVSNYSAIVAILRNAGAIEQVKRGGGSSVSAWQIINADASLNLASKKPSPLNVRQNMGRRLTALERRVDEMMLEHLKEYHAEAAED